MTGQSGESGGMIAVFVGEKYRIHAFERIAGFGQKFAQFFGGKSRIDEHAGVVGLEQSGVAGAATAKNAESKGH